MATLANLSSGCGFLIVIYSNDHNPPHLHLYKKPEDIKIENYYTRLLLPESSPKTVNDLQVMKDDRELTIQEKKLLLNWFLSPNRKRHEITNYVNADLIWDTFQVNND